MLEKIPANQELQALLGDEKYAAWTGVCTMIDSLYDMETLWDTGGKRWTYEYKYRRGGKTLCALYAKENCFGLLIIFGKNERAKFESEQATYSPMVQSVYDDSKTYHDGKWMLFELTDLSLLDDIQKLLQIKRRPNKK